MLLTYFGAVDGNARYSGIFQPSGDIPRPAGVGDFIFSLMFRYIVLSLLVSFAIELQAQFDINCTPTGYVTVRFLGCDPCHPDYAACMEVVQCKEACKVGFDFAEAQAVEMDCFYDCYYDHPPGTYDCDTYCRELAYGEYDACVAACGTPPEQPEAVGFAYAIGYQRAPIGVDPSGPLHWTGNVMNDSHGTFSYQIMNVHRPSNFCIALLVRIYFADGTFCDVWQYECFIFG